MEKRDFNSPQYKKLRLTVYRRDKFKCQFPNCNSNNKKLQCHHIKVWSLYPSLRFSPSNCLTLCEFHHKMVSGRESEFEVMFSDIVSRKGATKENLTDILMIKYKGRKKKDGEIGN